MIDDLHIVERKILYKELEPLFKILSSVNYAVVKGEVLSQQIYGVPNKRRSSDIDILIDKQNVKFLEAELQKLGFEQRLQGKPVEARRNRVLCMAYSHQIPSYHKDKYGFHLNVDINYDIFWGEYEGERYSINDFLSNTVEMNIYGVIVKTLPIEKAFVQLILHHYKEMNSLYHLSCHNSIKTCMFEDIYNFLSYNSQKMTMSYVMHISKQYKVLSFVYYMLYYCDQIYKDSFIIQYLSEFICEEGKRIIDCYGLCENERKKWKIPFAERLDKYNLWEYLVGEMSETDLEKIKLNSLVFL